MGIFNSSDVLAFPATRRETTPSARLMSEKALTQPIRSLSFDGTGTFIVTTNGEWQEIADNGSGVLEFYIYGYYFAVQYSAISPLISTTDLWVSLSGIDIIADTTSPYNGFYELTGMDNTSSQYTGLVYSTTEPTTTDYKLKIFSTGILNSSMVLRVIQSDWSNPFVVSAADIDDGTTNNGVPILSVATNKLWIDTTNGYIIRYYDSTTSKWIKLGAVYK